MKQQSTYYTAIKSSVFLPLLLLTLSINSWSQQIKVEGPYWRPEARSVHKLESIANPQRLGRTPQLTARMAAGRNACSTINTTYVGFTAEAVDAFEFAIEIWENSIESTVPITVSAEIQSLTDDVTAVTEPNGFFTIAGTGLPNTLYPRALAEKLTGSEIGGNDSVDILVTINEDIDFYYGLDANPPAGQVDFVTLILHELGHGMGFIGFAVSDGTLGYIRDNADAFPSIYDQFIENGSGASILSFDDPSAALHSELTSDNLFNNSSSATSENAGVKPKTYNPSTFDFFKSYDHWDSSVFPSGNINNLMTEVVSPGEAIHVPGPVTLEFMKDMGWSLCQSLSVESSELVSFEIIENPVKSSLLIRLGAQLQGSEIDVVVHNIGGKRLFERRVVNTSGQLQINEFSNLAAGLYFVTISTENGQIKATEKIIKN